MKGERELVNKIRAVMESANPVPVSTYESDVLYQADVADRIAALRLSGHGFSENGLSENGLSANGRSRRSRRSGWDGARGAGAWRVAAPALSALAVVAVVVSLSLAGGSAGRSGSEPHSAGPAAGAGSLPRYYVTINSRGFFKPCTLVVHNSLTGQTIAWLALPKSKSLNCFVTAAKSDREFFILADRTPGNFLSKQGLYRLRLAPDGHVTSFTTLSTNLGLGQSNGIDGIALSPDGAKLAVLVELTHLYSPATELVVIPLNHAPRRVWIDRHFGEYIRDPVWTSRNDIAFMWWDHLQGTHFQFPGRTQERLLNTTAPGSSLLSSRVLATSSAKLGLFSSALALPRGGPIIAVTYKNVPTSGNHGRANVRLVTISPTTGKVTNVFFSHVAQFHTVTERFDADFFYGVLGLNPTGRNVLGNFPRFGVLTGGVVTPLHGGPSQVISAAW